MIWLLFVAISVVLAAVLSLVAGALSTTISAISFVVAIAISIWLMPKTNWREKLLQLKWFEVAFYSVLLIFCYKEFVYLLFPSDMQLKTLNPNNFGDLPLHIAYIRNLAAGVKFWPQAPQLVSESMRYPFGVDMFNAMWDSLGVPLATHLFLVGMIFSVVVIWVLHQWGGIWANATFFLSSGVMWWGGADGKINYDAVLSWKNFFLTVWIPQRGFLFALPAGIILYQKLKPWLLNETKLVKKEIIALVVIWSSLPFMHAHTFFFINVSLFFIWLLNYRSAISIRTILTYFVWPLPWVLYVLYKITGSGKAASVARWEWFWEAKDKSFAGIIFYLYQNYWIWIPILFVLFLVAIRKAKSKEGKEVLVLLGLFALFHFLMLAPWTWDNIKLLIWPFLLLVPMWVALLQRQAFMQHLLPIVFVILFTPGFFNVFSAVNKVQSGAVALFYSQQISSAQKVVQSTPINSVFLTNPNCLSPVQYWGRGIVHGHAGHVWSHGYYVGNLESDIKDFYSGRMSNWQEFLKKYSVTHVYYGAEERSNFPPLNVGQEWRSKLKNISDVIGVDVYEVTN